MSFGQQLGTWTEIFQLLRFTFSNYTLQLIRVALHGIFVIAVYTLVESKTQETYRNMLRTIREECDARELYLDLLTINMDFEIAMLNAGKRITRYHIVKRGCF